MFAGHRDSCRGLPLADAGGQPTQVRSRPRKSTREARRASTEGLRAPGRLRSLRDGHSCWPAFGAQVDDSAVAARDVPIRLAVIHNSFERIHPFLDGNARVGRLVLNLILVRHGFPPAIIFKRQRAAYLRALDQCDKGDPAPLAEQLARSVIDNLHRFVVPNIAGPARLVPLRSLADDELTYEALRQAARRGRLVAHQGSDGVWRSSRHAVTQYKTGRQRRSNT